jgi:hypothetical protein
MSVGVGLLCCKVILSLFVVRAGYVWLHAWCLVTRARPIDPFFLLFFYPFDTEAPELPNTILYYEFE